MSEINNKINNIEFIQAGSRGTGFIINGTTGTGKTKLLLERYKYMVNKLGIPADSILVLLSNSQRLKYWKEEVDFELTAGLRCFTYTGFIQDEISTYYPLISKADKEIGYKEITPLYLGYDTSRFLVSRSIQLRRERFGAFQGLVSTNENAAGQLLKSLSSAALCGIPAEEAAIRLADALEHKNETKKEILSEADSIMKAYRSKCLELGVLDSALCISIYNEYLLNNLFYSETLRKRIRHILVDDLQDCTPVQTDLLEILYKASDTYAFTVNSETLSYELNAHIQNFAGNLEQAGCQTIKLQQSYTCSQGIFGFSELLADSNPNVLDEQVMVSEHTPGKTVIGLQNTDFIERHASTEFRNDMLQRLGERICSLILDEGYKPSDILVLSTYADKVTELVLSEILEARGSKLINLARREKFYENTLCRSILAFMQLCHPDCKLYPTRDDLRLMLCRLLKLDDVRSTILAGWISIATPFPKLPEDNSTELIELLGEEKYKSFIYIKHWIEEYKNQGVSLPVSDFIMKALTEIFMNDETGREELVIARKMADAAFGYTEAASRFGRNIIKDFISLSREQAFIPEDAGQNGDKLQEDCVILSTPAAFLAGNIRCRATVICSLSSRNWLQGGAGELHNPYVLNTQWIREAAYTAKMDESNRWKQMTQTLGMVLKRCSERIITFESGLSENGFINDGPLPSLFDFILNK